MLCDLLVDPTPEGEGSLARSISAAWASASSAPSTRVYWKANCRLPRKTSPWTTKANMSRRARKNPRSTRGRSTCTTPACPQGHGQLLHEELCRRASVGPRPGTGDCRPLGPARQARRPPGRRVVLRLPRGRHCDGLRAFSGCGRGPHRTAIQQLSCQATAARRDGRIAAASQSGARRHRAGGRFHRRHGNRERPVAPAANCPAVHLRRGHQQHRRAVGAAVAVDTHLRARPALVVPRPQHRLRQLVGGHRHV